MKKQSILLDTSQQFPEPEVFADTVEKHALDAIASGFESLEIKFYDPAEGWKVMSIDLRAAAT